MSSVSSCRFQYPFMIWGPAMQSSPGWPGATSFSPSSRSTILQSVSTIGSPIEPNFRFP
jgi:hypothetical protein